MIFQSLVRLQRCSFGGPRKREGESDILSTQIRPFAEGGEGKLEWSFLGADPGILVREGGDVDFFSKAWGLGATLRLLNFGDFRSKI